MLVGRILIFAGWVCSIFFGLLLVVAAINPGGGYPEVAHGVIIFSLICLIPSLIMLFKGRKRVRLYDAHELYAYVIASSPGYDIDQLALSVNEPVDLIRKNLEQMRPLGLFIKLDTPGTGQPVESLTPAATTAQNNPAASVAVKCEGCGADNAVLAGSARACEYCGSPLKVPA